MLALAVVFAAAVVAGILELGPPTSSARTSREVITAADGLVQSTVTGTGNVEAGTDVEANFQTSGILQNLYVKDGDHVVKGQLLATLDPTAAQLTLDQAEENLTAAEDQLTNAEDAQSSASSSSTTTSDTSDEVDGGETEFVTYHPSNITAVLSPTPPSSSSSSTTTTAPTRSTSGGTKTPVS